MIANCFESKLSAARLQSAGMSFRLVRSPVAPKMTMTQGEATELVETWFIRRCPVQESKATQIETSRRSRFLFRVAAKLKAHRGQNLRGKVAFAARQKPFVQRFRKYGSG